MGQILGTEGTAMEEDEEMVAVAKQEALENLWPLAMTSLRKVI